MMQRWRQGNFYKKPGIAETLDWGLAIMALGKNQLDENVVAETLGCVFKYHDDIQRAREFEMEEIDQHSNETQN